MSLNRRELIAMAAAVAAGCDRAGDNAKPSATQPAPPLASNGAPPAGEQVVDAGPISGFADHRVYDQFREQGFFVIRRDKTLFVLSSICTHKGCKVRAQADESFFCRCHKSAFDRDGRVLSGPAPRDLPRLAVRQRVDGHVLVNLSTPVKQKLGARPAVGGEATNNPKQQPQHEEPHE